MILSNLGALAFTALAGLAAAHAAPAAMPSEPALRQEVEQALWPNDIAELATDYMRLYPANPGGSWARELREKAWVAMRALGSDDVKLYRTAFQPHGVPATAPASANDDLRRAALGDKDAALRVAKIYEPLADTPGPNADRYVGWMQFASKLGSDKASYELALHYRRQNQPALASKFEARAIELGFKPPPALDHIRK